jgi:hypothetical protein
VTATTAEFGDVTVSGKVVAKKYCFPDVLALILLR